MSTPVDKLLSQIPDPSQSRDASAWDDLAADIVERAIAQRVDAAAVDEVLAPPDLVPEADEPGTPIEAFGTSTSVVPMSQRPDSRRLEPAQIPGARSQMSDDRDSQARPSQSANSAGPASRARPSLKDLAVRVSKTPPPPVSSRAGSSPDSMPIPSGPISNAPIVPPRAADAKSADRISSAPISTSLIAVPTAADGPSSVPPASGKASEHPAVATASKAPPTLASGAKTEEKGGSLVWLYGLVGVGVAAAAGYFLFVKQPATTPTAQPATTVVVEDDTKRQEADLATPEQKKPEGEVLKDDSVDLNAIGDTTAKPVVGGRLPTASTGEALAMAPSGTPWTPPEDKKVEKVEADGTLSEALREKAGAIEEKSAATPASDDTGPKNLPDKPPQGSLTAAASSARSAAKSCVSGADENTSINIVFGSSGSVQSVSVGGWAAGKSAEGCIKSAVKGVSVSPFSKPTYPLSVTLRP